jgi:uncharacterized protein
MASLLREGLGDTLEQDAQTLLDMMTDDISFEFPLALPDGITRLEGKSVLQRFVGSAFQRPTTGEFPHGPA